MTKYLIILILMIIIFLLLLNTNKIEKFNIFNPVTRFTPKSFQNISNYYKVNYPNTVNTKSIFENRISLIPVTINNTTINNSTNVISQDNTEIRTNKCCLVKKKIDADGFKYEYHEYKDLDCDINNFELDQNNQLLFDGQDNWSNNNCNIKKSNLGACKHNNSECFDFVSKDSCDKYNLLISQNTQPLKPKFTWNKAPCYTPIN